MKILNKKEFIVSLKIIFIIFIIVVILFVFVEIGGERNSIVMVVMDSASAAHFSCYGYRIKTTPNIDTVAERSYIFTNAYTTAVFTRTSVASMFTSLYPIVHELFGRYSFLPKKAITVAEILQKNSYRTVLFTTTGNVSQISGLDQGFKEIYRFKWDTEPNKITSQVIDWLKKNKNNKYFVYIHYRQPHFPFDAPMVYRRKFTPPELQSLFEKKNLIKNIYAGRIKYPDQKLIDYMKSQYDANLYYIDNELKALFDYITYQKKKTILIITSDHGEAFGEYVINNRLWFGHHWDLHKNVISIPLIIYPSKDGHKNFIKNIVENIDFMPTILDLANVKEDVFMQGKSFYPCLYNTVCETKEYAFTQAGVNKLLSIISDKYQFIYNFKQNIRELYKLNQYNEIEERDDVLYNKYLDLAKLFREKIIKIKKNM